MKVLVTGSRGVAGSSIKRLANNFQHNFTFSTSSDVNLCNMEATLNYIGAEKPDAIIHLAAVSGGIGLSATRHASMLRDNLFMNFNILEAARIHKVKKVIMTLSTGMYPPNCDLPHVEDQIHLGNPHASNYGMSFAKRMVEPAVRAYRQEYGMNVIGLIPSGIFGPEDNFHPEHAPFLPTLISRVYDAKKTGGNVIVWGDGTPIRDYTYADDIAEIFIWALENYDSDQVMNIGSVEEHTIREIAEIICNKLDVSIDRLEFDTSKPSGVYKKSVSNKRFIKLNNFSYTSLRDGISKTVDWYVQTIENSPELLRKYSKSKG